eukprot:781152-Amphidinium_carterae.1
MLSSSRELDRLAAHLVGSSYCWRLQTCGRVCRQWPGALFAPRCVHTRSAPTVDHEHACEDVDETNPVLWNGNAMMLAQEYGNPRVAQWLATKGAVKFKSCKFAQTSHCLPLCTRCHSDGEELPQH